MIIVWYLILGFLLMVLTVTLFNGLTAPMLIRGPLPEKSRPVSILVPARNESQNITACLESLLRQTYPDFEILVLDDQSSDDTLQKVKTLAETNRQIRILEGTPLPPGWTGKNWACHQLSEAAKGDVFIFTDADNRYAQSAIAKTAGWMEKYDLDLFSAFPQQDMRTLTEKLTVPSVYMTVYCYLPLWLTYYLPFSSLAAANGQWLAFTRSAYQKLKAHQTARAEIVEDTWLARYAKKRKMKILTAAGTGAVFGRMYRTWFEVKAGFSKNLFGLMGYQTIPFIVLMTLMCLAYVMPYMLIFLKPVTRIASASLLVNLMIRLILVLKYKDPLISLVLHPAGILMTILIGFKSIILHRSGRLEWKGRRIETGSL